MRVYTWVAECVDHVNVLTMVSNHPLYNMALP